MTEMSETHPPEKETRRQSRVGTVTSAGSDKTIRVEVNQRVRHPMYGKYVRKRTRLAVHDPKNEAQVGDRVEIVPCRPMSKTKAWRLARIVRGAEAAGQRSSDEG